MSENSKKIIPMEERIKPMRVIDNDNGAEYELDFNREAVRFAEGRGFEVDTVVRFPATKVSELFYYSFRKNHRKMTKTQTDDLMDKMGGLTTPMLERLISLYQQAALTHVISTEEDSEKNAKVTVEL